MKRKKYQNGDTIGMVWNGCDSCQIIGIDGIPCHEIGCPDAWRDNSIECDDCGCDFIRSERDETICPDCSAAADPDFIPPGIEVFYRTRGENRRDGWMDSDGQPLGAGWYWWSCFPGCLPDSDPIGPFDSERESIDDCKGW